MIPRVTRMHDLPYMHKHKNTVMKSTLVILSIAVLKASHTVTAAAAGPFDKPLQNIGRSVPKQVKDTLSNVQSKLFPQKSTQKEKQDALIEDMKNVAIRAVVAPKSKVLPPQVVELAAKRSGMIGRPLNGASVSECAKFIKQWYHRQGYVLSSVVGATLNPDGVTELQVEEPIMSVEPVDIQFAKEMVVVEDAQGIPETMSFKQYRKLEASKSRVRSPVKRSDLNTTFVQTVGRTRSGPIAKTLELEPGVPFRWDKSRWQRILRAGMFDKVLRVSPERQQDGTVQLQVIASEKPPRNLEYGVSKSFYTGGWEGEVEFEHQNLFGAGEIASLSVRRGAKDPYASIKTRFTDNRFGMSGGYGLEAFNEYIGVDEEDESEPTVVDDVEGDQYSIEHDTLLGRTGVTFSLNHPLASVMDHSAGSACLERTITRAGKSEMVASTSMEIGPFLRGYPEGVRHSLQVLLTGGGRLASKEKLNMVPFATGTIVAKEIFPLSKVERPISLALKHSVTTSTPSLPMHEAKASGVRANVRGYGSSNNGAVSTSVVGTTEIRVPLTLPISKLGQNASLVLFGDWHFVEAAGGSRGKKVMGGKFSRKSSIGVGLRKAVQGIPLKYDVCITEDGRFGTHFSLGGDFDVI